MSTLDKAIAIAAEAHTGQVDKMGAPYILHPLRLMLRFEGETERMVAVLHDVVEDSTVTLADLRAAGFAPAVIDALDCLTHRAELSYTDYVARLSDNPLARRVKLADLEDNMDMRRLEVLTPKALARLERYHHAWIFLKGIDAQQQAEG